VTRVCVAARPRVLLLVDRPGWAFDIIARAFAARLARRFEIRILARDVEQVDVDPRDVDLVYAFWWGDRSFAHLELPPEKVVREVASHRWQVEARYGRLSPQAFVDAHLRDCATVTTPSRRLAALLRPLHPRVLHVPCGVDTRLFTPPRRRTGNRLRVAWVGNPRDATKGLRDVLEPACAGLCELIPSSGRQTQRELVSLYQRVDVIAVASLAEGQPLPLMEGMACGAFPVTTDVGIAPELVRHRVNGLVVERTPEAFREALAWCQRNLAYVRRAGRFDAELMRAERSWDLLANRFGDVLDAALGRAPLPPPEPLAPDGPLRASLARGCLPARVALVTPELATSETATGGLGNYVRRIATALAESGHRPEIFTPGHGDAREERNGVVVHRVRPAHEHRLARAALRALGALRLRRLARVLPLAVEAWSLAAALRRAGRDLPYDLIQSAGLRGVGLFVRRRADAFHLIRCSSDAREVARWSGQPLGERAAVDWMARLALRRADRLYAPSRFLAERLAREGLQVEVVAPPAFLEAKPAAQPPRGLPPRYFVHFGQLMPVKGTPEVVHALVRVLAEQPDFAFVFAGRDRMGRFDEWARAWRPHAERVRWLGELQKPELYALVAGADAAVLPSRFDNLPNTVIESLLLGVPVIGTAGASVDELVTPGATGVLVPDGDVGALADAMLAQWRRETGVHRGFAWQPGSMRADVAVARLLELGGLHAPR
jgi:glycosyltransferase involved in cell wall biosynthesis